MKSDTISIGRGLCIILMVMAHAGSPMWVTRFVYMFHMPFFFIISGYCLNESYFSQTKLFLEKRVKGLYIPYIKWSLLFLLFHNVFFHFHFISFKLVSLFIVLLNYEPLNRIAEFPQIRSYSQEGWWIAYTAVGVIIPLIISHYYTNAKNINYKSTRI